MTNSSPLKLKERQQTGFSLIELMVALLIGLLVTLGAFQAFVISKKSFDQTSAIMQRQESLRYLVDSLSYDIRSAESLGVLTSDNSQLTLSFDKENTYCSGTNRYSLEYRQPENENAIYLDVSCVGGGGSGESIVVGVGEIKFFYTQAATATSGAYSTIPIGPVGIVLNIKMVDDTGLLKDEVYSFRIANRASVGKALEKKVGP